MNLFEQTKELCRLYDIKPARSKGQNFLISEEIYDQMIVAANLQPNDIILEVGPGLGFLTAKLAKRVSRVIAVELDDKLAEILRTGLMAQGIKNVEVINKDILQFSSLNYKLQNYKVVANLPYNITSIFLRKFLEMEIKPELMVLMLQKEVAERIAARPGKMSVLGISVQFYANAEMMQIVPAENFWPKPEVDSAIIKIKIRADSLLKKEQEKNFFQLIKFGFSAKRKMLKNNLAAGFKIDQTETEKKIISAGLNSKIRAQELSINDWLKLLTIFNL
ncbi:MAG: 16S rRNA (adenine(1518)-N(6)/adenine(1519)-N(6))-dimethyltransferase RsmA [Patescibacteria group bacterium]|jgi:16S rRNA (adenine1518-N6/adenine1519-N6)-dimethyltransferase